MRNVLSDQKDKPDSDTGPCVEKTREAAQDIAKGIKDMSKETKLLKKLRQGFDERIEAVTSDDTTKMQLKAHADEMMQTVSRINQRQQFQTSNTLSLTSSMHQVIGEHAIIPARPVSWLHV